MDALIGQGLINLRGNVERTVSRRQRFATGDLSGAVLEPTSRVRTVLPVELAAIRMPRAVHQIMRGTKGLYNPADAGSEVVGVRLAVARLLEAFMRKDHPIDRLVATVERSVSSSVANSMQASSDQLAGRRQWVLGPPELFDESDARDGRSLGFVLSIYTARPPWDEGMDRMIDRAHLDEVKELLGEICRISGESNVSFIVDFAGETIGTVEEGRTDESLEVGLISEWERVLDEPDQ